MGTLIRAGNNGTTPRVEFDEETGRLSISGSLFSLGADPFLQDLTKDLLQLVDCDGHAVVATVELSHIISNAHDSLHSLFYQLAEALRLRGRPLIVSWVNSSGDFKVREFGNEVARRNPHLELDII